MRCNLIILFVLHLTTITLIKCSLLPMSLLTFISEKLNNRLNKQLLTEEIPRYWLQLPTIDNEYFRNIYSSQSPIIPDLENKYKSTNNILNPNFFISDINNLKQTNSDNHLWIETKQEMKNTNAPVFVKPVSISHKSDIKYKSIINLLQQRIPRIKSELKKSDNNRQIIDYQRIVNDLQKTTLNKINRIMVKENVKEKEKSTIDYRKIINKLHDKELSNIYSQENVFNPMYEYGFKPIFNDNDRAQTEIKNYLKYLNEEKQLDIEVDESNSAETGHESDSNQYTIDTAVRSENDDKASNHNSYFDNIKDNLDMAFTKSDIGSFVLKNHNQITSNQPKLLSNFNFLSNLTDLTQFKTSGINCASYFGWCEYDHTYPRELIEEIVEKCDDQIKRMYIEMPTNLSDFHDYEPYSIIETKNKSNINQISLCATEKKFITPSVGQDINGNYFVILQTDFYRQHIGVEICRIPGSKCRGSSRCGGISVRCTQKYRTHLLISVDVDNITQCPNMRLYRFPAACVCDASHFDS